MDKLVLHYSIIVFTVCYGLFRGKKFLKRNPIGFIALSFIAIRNSAKNSSNPTVKVLFYIFWAILFGLILNESIHIFHLPEIVTYISAFSLCALHIYNLKYCQCDDENCCVNDQ